MKQRKNKAIEIGNGQECPKCEKKMIRKEHPSDWVPSKSYYYTQWDHCKPCGHVQHYEQFKSNDWKEAERQENFFKNI